MKVNEQNSNNKFVDNEQFFANTVNCMKKIRSIVDKQKTIKLSEVESMAVKYNTRTTNVLDMLELYGYITDYTKGIVSKK